MEFYRIWRILVGHKWIMIILPLVATIVGLGLTYALPELYESTALVLVRPVQSIKFNPSANPRELVDFPVNLSAPIDAPSKTYIELIKSHAVAVKIVEALKLDVKEPVVYEGWFDEFKDSFKNWAQATLRTVRNYLQYGRDIPATPFDLAVDELGRNLVVTPQKDTYVFDIAYRSSKPAKSAAVANMAAEIFLDQSADAYRTEAARTREFLEKQLDESRKALDEARAATLAYKNTGGTFDIKGEYNDKLQNVSDLENTLAKDESKLAGLERTEFKSGPAVASLQAEIEELKAQIRALRTDLAGYPDREAKLNAISLNERLADDSYEFFLKQYEEARVREAADVAEIRIVSRAAPGLYPVKPLKYVYAGIAFLSALVVAAGWALLDEYLNPRIRTPRDLDEDLSLPVLGAIPLLR